MPMKFNCSGGYGYGGTMMDSHDGQSASELGDLGLISFSWVLPSWKSLGQATRQFVKRIGFGFLGIYLIELAMRLTKVSWLTAWLPSVMIASFGSFLFLGCSKISYGFLMGLRHIWDFLIELQLWRELINSLSLFKRVGEVILSPLGFVFGVANYIYLHTKFSSYLPAQFLEILPSIRSVSDYLVTFFDVKFFPSMIYPAFCATFLFFALLSLIYHFGTPLWDRLRSLKDATPQKNKK